jgi:hypothetical protein
MSETMPRARSYGKSTPRADGRHKVQHALGAASSDSAHKQIQRGFEKAERVAQILALRGKTLPVTAHLSRLQDILADGPVEPITQAFRTAGTVDRAEDESREACLANGCTPDELDLEESRLLRQIDQSYVALRCIRAHRRGAR